MPIVKTVKYVLKKNGKEEVWKANVAGKDADEIIAYLRKSVAKDIIVQEINELGRLDAVTDQLRETIAKPLIEKMKRDAKKVKK